MDEPRRENLPLLELDILRTFVAIADTGNFTTAAEAVLRTPSAVSMQIKKLEDMLGATLFRRDARAVTLTHHGEILLSAARRMLAMNNEIVGRFVRPHMNGVVNLGAPDDIGDLVLPEVLRRFAEAYPMVAVDVRIEGSETLRRHVAEGKLDIALFNCTAGNFNGEGETALSRKAGLGGKEVRQCLHALPHSGFGVGSGMHLALEGARRTRQVGPGLSHCLSQRPSHGAARSHTRGYRHRPACPLSDRRRHGGTGRGAGAPDIGYYDVGMVMRAGAPETVDALAEYIRGAVVSIGKTVEMAA